MAFFGLGKKYTEEDLQREVTKLQSLYRQAIGIDRTDKSRTELKNELSKQLHLLLEVCRKGHFSGMETVEWCPNGPSYGCFCLLNNVTPPVEILLQIL